MVSGFKSRPLGRDALGLAGAWDGQGVFQGMSHGLVNFTPIPKAHLDLGGVHIHIDPLGVDVEVKRINGLALSVQHVFVSAAGRVADDFVADKAAIDIGELLVGTRARRIGHARPTGHGDGALLVVNFDR